MLVDAVAAHPEVVVDLVQASEPLALAPRRPLLAQDAPDHLGGPRHAAPGERDGRQVDVHDLAVLHAAHVREGLGEAIGGGEGDVVAGRCGAGDLDLLLHRVD
eukprot:4674827-Alexandrium_andersonii.AAC.1